ncbi:MAG TPA: homocysteine methyltransferase [Clostridiales bacterium]|nr:homocysteine methyltransferase [Clostridiales bacterium]
MNVLDCIKQDIFFLDGGSGSYLQAQGWLKPGDLPEMLNLTEPEAIISMHRAYYEAGSHAVCANTFGANALKFDGKDGRPSVSDVVNAAVNCAKKARDSAKKGQENRFIALDMGPLGRLLSPMGDMPFDTAVNLFAEIVLAGSAAGADFILIETMSDSYETKAAVLAAKENCSLPVFVSNVYDKNEKMLSGTSPEAMVAMLEGLGADVIGLNCSLGPDKMLEILPRFTTCASVPILVKPNAGLPRSENGKTVYDISDKKFAQIMKKIAAQGASVVGGCCGTTPEYIAKLVETAQGILVHRIEKKKFSVVSSYTHAITFGNAPVLIGERINPTGKKHFKQALRDKDTSYILKEGIAQQEQGVHILDVNVGLPEIDEVNMLEVCVKELQGICNLPLQLDTSNYEAMERAMRIYNGKPMVNSVNGSAESMDVVFPLIKKYGGLAVCLTLDENGIPEIAEERFKIAQKIAERAADYGIGIHDLIFDPLTLAVSSDFQAAIVTLDTIPLIRERLGACCSLGVSNISFGLPKRDFVTAAFFTMALTKGLDAAIINPFSVELQKAYHSYMTLAGHDPNCQTYINFAQSVDTEKQKAVKSEVVKSRVMKPIAGSMSKDTDSKLGNAIIRGLTKDAAVLAREALTEMEPLILINEHIVPALDVVGREFEENTVFLPQLLLSARAANAAFEEVKLKMPSTGEEGLPIVLATVKGDIHDIGKNIVKVLLENYGYKVIDLGRDVDPEIVLEATVKHDAKLVGLSALMTTTVPAMADTIKLLKEKLPNVRIVVGGAVLTQEYADMIGADHYADNAMEGVRYAEQVYGSDI